MRPFSDLLCPHLSSNHSRFIHQSSLLWLHQTHPVGKRGKTGREMAAEFCLSVSLSCLKGSLISRKSYNMRIAALLPLRRKLCYGFLSPLKIHRSQPGLNPPTLGPIATTITIRPPGKSLSLSLLLFSIVKIGLQQFSCTTDTWDIR
jgi:hypothetical protein